MSRESGAVHVLFAVVPTDDALAARAVHHCRIPAVVVEQMLEQLHLLLPGGGETAAPLRFVFGLVLSLRALRLDVALGPANPALALDHVVAGSRGLILGVPCYRVPARCTVGR